MGRKMFNLRQTQAAIRIQAWWRKQKHHTWFRLVTRIRTLAAMRMQRAWRTYKFVRIIPNQNKHLHRGAAIKIQTAWRGYIVRKKTGHQIRMMRMERTFRYFGKMQHDLQKGAILFIIRHWKKYVAKLKQERSAAKKKKKGSDSKKKSSQTGTGRASQKSHQNAA